MGNFVEQFGSFLSKKVDQPEQAQKWLLRSYRAFGFFQRHFPDRKKPKSKQYLANACMDFMIEGFSNPSNTAFVSVFMPCEILQGFDLSPMCAEMFSTYLNGADCEQVFVQKAKEAGISDTYCSYHKVVMGAALTGVLPKNLCIVNTSLACDANNLTFRSLHEIQNIPQFYIDVPYLKDEESVTYVANQLKECVSFLQNVTGRKFQEDKFLEAIQHSKETVANMKKVQALRKDTYIPTDLTSELYEVLMMHNGLGSKQALEYSKLLYEDYLKGKKQDGIKLVWMHTNPFYQKPIQELLNYRKDQYIVATEMSYDMWQEFEEDDPYRYMAKRLVYDPYNGSLKDRIEYTKNIASDLEADGIVVFCHWGCKETCGGSSLMKRAYEVSGYPTLILNGDGVDRENTSNGQLKTRLSAFLEMLKRKTKE